MRWWECATHQTFSLAGYAGTGKTTILAQLLERFKGHVVVAAPTGKAAQRLREKGVKATTIHSLAYRFRGHNKDGDPEFDYTGIEGNPLVIIDEASMVNGEIYKDLLGGGYRMLFVGDHGQLPPVGEDPGIMRRPDFALSVIHRQDDKGLLDFAHAVRLGGDPAKVPIQPDTKAVQRVWIDPRREPEEVREAITNADTVLCWRNSTRHWLNWRIMQLRGRIDIPYEGDSRQNVQRILHQLWKADWPFPVVCLRNDHRLRIWNGQLFELRIEEILSVRDSGREPVLIGSLYNEGAANNSVRALEEPIRRDVQMDMRGFRMTERGYQPAPGVQLFDFGCCLTTHKSQGSEWPWVCVWDDTHSRMEDRARWAYTAATRAKERLSWLHR